jgi:hypothetical protein
MDRGRDRGRHQGRVNGRRRSSWPISGLIERPTLIDFVNSQSHSQRGRPRCPKARRPRLCRLWVRSGKARVEQMEAAYPSTADIEPMHSLVHSGPEADIQGMTV